jgi:hypothetical protein
VWCRRAKHLSAAVSGVASLSVRRENADRALEAPSGMSVTRCTQGYERQAIGLTSRRSGSGLGLGLGRAASLVYGRSRSKMCRGGTYTSGSSCAYPRTQSLDAKHTVSSGLGYS